MVLDSLSVGQKLAQVSHACFGFASEHPEITKKWMTESNYICILSASELEMFGVIEKAQKSNITYSVFKEPDLNDSITAIALEPGDSSKNLCKKFKLA